MSNYPPGMSKRDFVRAGIDDPHNHECEFLMDDDRANPIIEEGAAIFHTECRYVEGEYGQGYSCEETRSYRFEYDVLELLGGGEIQLPTINEWEKVNDELAEVVVAIEEAWHNGDSRVELSSIDPDPKHGEVAIDYLGYTLCYRPE